MLPSDIAAQASSAAFNLAWYATNSRMGPKGDVAQNWLAAQDCIADMKSLGAGLLTDAIVEDFKWLAFNAGWCAANRRHGISVGNQALLDQATQNEATMNEHANNLAATGLLDEALVTNLKWMAWRASWFAANTRDQCCPDDAKTDKTYFDQLSQIIQGEVVLLSVDFDDKAGRVAGQQPAVVGDQVMDNWSDQQESMTFAYSYTEGKTDSWSNTLGFKIGIKNEFKGGFIFASEKFDLSYEASFSHVWAGGTSSGVTKAYTYPLVVPPHRIYQGKATVHQATMEVPYQLNLSIGGYPWISRGTWNGVAVSISTYTVTDITPGVNATGMAELDLFFA